MAFFGSSEHELSSRVDIRFARMFRLVKAWVNGCRGRLPALALVTLEMRRVAALGSDGVAGRAGVPKAAAVADAVEIQADVRFRLYAIPPREEAGLALARDAAPGTFHQV